jgi:hypothetical protein
LVGEVDHEGVEVAGYQARVSKSKRVVNKHTTKVSSCGDKSDKCTHRRAQLWRSSNASGAFTIEPQATTNMAEYDRVDRNNDSSGPTMKSKN